MGAGATVIVGVAAAADALDALEQLLGNVTAEAGVAFVVVPQPSDDHGSMIRHLARHAALPVVTATDGDVVEADTIYVVPPSSEMIISGGALKLTGADPGHGPGAPVEVFLRSLAHDRGPASVGVILAGAGGESSPAAREIRDAGGLIIRQAPASPPFDPVPRAPVATSVGDLIAAPDQMAAAIRRHAERSCERPDMGEGFILVVEDDTDSRELIAMLLASDGYRVRTADDGASAVAILRSARPQLALIDLGIPAPDGNEVARVARELHPDVVLVAMSGYAESDDERAAAPRFDEHILKPIGLDRLRSVLDRFLTGRRA